MGALSRNLASSRAATHFPMDWLVLSFVNGERRRRKNWFEHKSIAYRHLGFFGPNQGEFTILFPAEEKNWIYVPEGCIDIAVGRMKSVMENQNNARDATIQVPPENV